MSLVHLSDELHRSASTYPSPIFLSYRYRGLILLGLLMYVVTCKCPCHSLSLFNVMYLSCLLSVAFAHCLQVMFSPFSLRPPNGVIWARHVFSYVPLFSTRLSHRRSRWHYSHQTGTMAWGNMYKAHTSHIQPIDAPCVGLVEGIECTRLTRERIHRRVIGPAGAYSTNPSRPSEN